MTERNDSRDVSHLPECLQIVGKGSGPCVCWLLRACEERVTDEIWGAIREGSQYKSGFEGGLDAARERLLYVALNYSTDPEFHALAAIDALKDTP